jgi:hypothetical protein
MSWEYSIYIRLILEPLSVLIPPLQITNELLTNSDILIVQKINCIIN